MELSHDLDNNMSILYYSLCVSKVQLLPLKGPGVVGLVAPMILNFK